MKEKLIELLSKSDILCDDCGQHGNSYCIEAIADYLVAKGVTMPVRCKDCKHYDVFRLECHNGRLNGWIGVDGFCSNGERK